MKFVRRFRFWLGRRNRESDFHEEISQHLELKIQENIASGMSAAKAARAAHLEFGNPALAHEHSRASWGFPSLESIVQDVRMAMRQLRRQPGFAVAAVLTLTLGIGINVAVFSLVNAILLAPLNYPRPDLLVDVAETNPAQRVEREEVSYPNLLEFRQQSHSFSQLAAYVSNSYTLRSEDSPERVNGTVASANLFSILGGTVEFGRSFTREEDQPGSANAVLLSHALWQKRLGGDPAIVGKTVLIDDELYTVAGIMNPGFHFPSVQTQMWLSLGPLVGQHFMQIRGVHILSVLGQLKAGVDARQATAEVRKIAAGIQQQFPAEDPGHSAIVVPFKDVVVRGARSELLMLSGSVAFILLIVCANITNLLLSRTSMRSREISIRKALGATRRRILRQLLTENLVLATLGGGCGLLLAKLLLMLFSPRLAVLLPRMQEVQLNLEVLLFALIVAVMSSVLFGMAPAFHYSKAGAEGEVSRSSGMYAAASRRSQMLHRGLVVAEIAVTLVLLTAGGLLLKSLQRVLSADRGFDSDNLLTMTATLPANQYQTGQQVAQFFDRVKSALERTPGIQAVSGTSELPLSGGDAYGELTIEGQTFLSGEPPAASFRRIFPNYFQCMSIPLVQGRTFQESDDGRRMTVIINQTLAHRFWPKGDALGKRIKIGPAASEPSLTIVGVVGDVRNERLDSDPRFATYEPYLQRPRDSIKIVIRTAGEPARLAGIAEDIVRKTEKDAVVYDVDTMDHQIAELVYPRGLLTRLSASFGLLALALAAVGLYGVLSYWVGQRTREIGIQMALGAVKADVLKRVLVQGLTLTAVGLTLGIVGALVAGRLLTSFLFAVTGLDLQVFGAAALVLAVVAGVAAYLPARRATEVDPMVALRDQ